MMLDHDDNKDQVMDSGTLPVVFPRLKPSAALTHSLTNSLTHLLVFDAVQHAGKTQRLLGSNRGNQPGLRVKGTMLHMCHLSHV